jgi:hypothetical protein
MAERMTDAFNRLFSSLVNSIVNYTKAGCGLPITVINTTPIAATATTVLTITMPTDAWVSGIYPTCATAAGAQLQDVWVDRIDIAGFQIWDMQGALGPIYGEAVTSSAMLPATPQARHGYARPFLVRQGDTISVSFSSLNAAVQRGTVFIDAYRADALRPA